MSTFLLNLAEEKGFLKDVLVASKRNTQTKMWLWSQPQPSSGHSSIPPITPAKQRLYCVNQPRLPVLPARPHPRLTLAGQCGYPFILAKTKSPALYSRGRGRAMSLG